MYAISGGARWWLIGVKYQPACPHASDSAYISTQLCSRRGDAVARC